MTGVWATADVITAARMNEKTIFQGTGAAISGLATTYPGMLAFCTSTGSGFTANHLYERNAADAAWREIPTLASTTPTTNNVVVFDGTDWVNRAPVFELLDDHTASGTESTYTFTPGTTITKSTHSMIYIVFDGAATASLALQMQINGLTTSLYDTNGFKADCSAITNISAMAAAQFQLASSTMLSGTPTECSGQAYLFFHNSGVSGRSNFLNAQAPKEEQYSHRHQSATTITSITLKTSTSTWVSGTKIRIYGMRII